MSREQTKANSYIQQLNASRCEGNWAAIGELVRKVKKHAPQRTCLVITAEAEAAAVNASLKRSNIARTGTAGPPTAGTVSTTLSNLRMYIELLKAAIETERTYAEDQFQAQVCLAWIHWQLGELALVANDLGVDIEQRYAQLDGSDNETSDWTKCCSLKASYLKGTAQERTGSVAEAYETFESGLPILASVTANAKQGKELKSWTELYLTGFCMLGARLVKNKFSSVLETETITAFRTWARFWDSQGSSPVGGRAIDADIPRRLVWREYYITMSDLLQQDLPFPTTSLTIAYTETSTRLQQRSELKRVEARYETLLLSEVQFPKADAVGEEVQAFVEIVMQNWRVLCGSSWDEDDLGEGGFEAVSRGVLDILYRAATKTFHSTAILRHLFTVHLAVAEFDLAFKAFDTYLEIVKKGKARVAKSGEEEPNLDDDETVLMTASECIKALCKYGSRQGAEKAKELGTFFETWLEKHHPHKDNLSNGDAIENRSSDPADVAIDPKVFATTWRCIGIGHANWSRLTYDASSRSDIQLHAIKCFKKALSPQYDSTKDVETMFALGVILAERREVSAAIDVVKSGLLPDSSADSSTRLGPHSGRFARERSLISLWHLLALLLSARQEFITAARSCEGAFEQFKDSRYLFGDADVSGTYRSTHLNEKPHQQERGVVDDMGEFEKQGVLEVKMTQLALIEILEGPDVAVNASDELLSLYWRLYGDPVKELLGSTKKPTNLSAPPKSSAGTIRSLKGSIFGRHGKNSMRKRIATDTMINEEESTQMRPQTTQTAASMKAPMIHVTSENGTSGRSKTSAKDHAPQHDGKLQKRNDSVSRKKSLRGRSRSTGRKRSSSDGTALQHTDPTIIDGEKFFTPPVVTATQDSWIRDNQTNTGEGVGGASLVHRPNTQQTQQMDHKEKQLQCLNDAQDTRLPHVLAFSTSTNPVTRFPKDQEQRRRTTVLIKIWLMVSGFYRRASMYEDAKGAIAEAEKLVQRLENDTLKDTTGNAWAGGKTVGELWGDVLAERGYLALAEKSPYDALARFESALTYFPDHPVAIVGLSNILLDIYSEDLLPQATIPKLDIPNMLSAPSASVLNTSSLSPPAAATPLSQQSVAPTKLNFPPQPISLGPLGLSNTKHTKLSHGNRQQSQENISTPSSSSSSLQPTYKESSTALLDRFAARDRAYGLLTALTKLGTGWNNSEAWFALSHAYELGGQVEKAREVLWWCIELEEGRAVREWSVVSGGGYVL